MTAPITRFYGLHRFMSNFWPAVVVFEGYSYPTVEHAYCAAKTLDKVERTKIMQARTPGEAKRLGKKVTIRRDWDELKLSVMEDLARQKFQKHSDLRRGLLATGNAEIFEGNTWGDKFWGVCRGEGHNHLGKILMKVRSELRLSQAIQDGYKP